MCARRESGAGPGSMCSESLWVANPELLSLCLPGPCYQNVGAQEQRGLCSGVRDLAGASPYGARRWPFPTAINWLGIPHGWVVGTRARPAGCLPVRFCRKHRKQKKSHPHAGPQQLGGLRTPEFVGPKACLRLAVSSLPQYQVPRNLA